MRDKRRFFSSLGYAWLLSILLVAVCTYCFVKPLVLSVDSVFGFLAYKGTLFFHSFNVIQDIPTNDIGKVNPVFVSWWSPGQWLFPGLLNYIFGIRLGVAAILVTMASLISGFFGYYRIFDFYKFPRAVILLSLMVIFSSSTLYYCFILYQGGEILEFALFPWYLLYVIRIRKVSWRNLIGITILFLLCFLAKTTLLLYCTLVLMAKLVQMIVVSYRNRFRFSKGNFWLLLPALFCLVFISVFFLSRGPKPTVIRHFGISIEGILVPLSSPLNSILSIQQYIKRGEVIFSWFSPGITKVALFSFALYLLVFAILIWGIRRIFLNKEINSSYKSLFFILYAGLMGFFIFAYSFNTNIDFNSRHFKLMGYLFAPGFITVVQEKIRKSLIRDLVMLFCVISVVDIFYLKEKWTKNRYISVNYFYRNCDPPGIPDKLDKASYQSLLKIEHEVLAKKGNSAVFFVESTVDIAIDLVHPFIIQTPSENIWAKVYRGSSPRVFVCISKSTLLENEGILQFKFPDYKDFELIGETDDYRFFVCSERACES